jgi:hypothetical protein
MFDPTSRYYKLDTGQLPTVESDGSPRNIVYKRRRFIPDSRGNVTLVQHTVTQGERLDVIVARYLGDPLQFWRVCDANNVLRPTELTDDYGTVIRIAMPGF